MGSEQPHVFADYADINLVDAIKCVSGVGDVKNFTAQDYSMRVWLQPNKMLRWALRLRTLRTQSASRMRKRQPFDRTTTTFLIRECEDHAD
jgi:multidrug efflux pump subunit AcrB